MRARPGRAALLLGLIDLAACGGSSPAPVNPPAWGVPEVLGTAQQMGTLSGDGNGRAVAVWIPIAGPDEGAAIVARRFAPATGWAPQVADTSGGAVATWREPMSGSSSWTIMANRFAAR